jgi:hypothetical protein
VLQIKPWGFIENAGLLLCISCDPHVVIAILFQALSSSALRRGCTSLHLMYCCLFQHGTAQVTVTGPASNFLTNANIFCPSSTDALLKATCDEWSKVQVEELWEKHWFRAFDMFYQQDNMCVLCDVQIAALPLMKSLFLELYPWI